MIAPKWGELKIFFEMESGIFLSDQDLKIYKSGKWVKGDLIEDGIRIAKEAFYKQIVKMNFEEFKKHLRIEEMK